MQSYNNPNQPPPPYPNQPQPPYQGAPGYPNQPPPPYPNYGPPPTPPRRRRGRIWLWLLGLVVVVAVLAVIGAVTGVVKFSGSFTVTDGSTPAQTSAASTASATSGSSTTTGGNVTVREMTMAKGFDGDNAVNPGTSFSPTDNPLYGVAKLDNAKVNTVVRGSFIAVDAGGEKGTEILTKDLTVQAAGPQVINFQLTLPRDWPTGKYRFDLYLDGKLARSVNYEIK